MESSSSDLLKCNLCNISKKTIEQEGSFLDNSKAILCHHQYVCDGCNDHENFYDNHMLYYGVCVYCILEGDADLLDSVMNGNYFGGGNYYELADFGKSVIDMGLKASRISDVSFLESMETHPIKFTGNCGDPKRNISCFRELYTIGFQVGMYRKLNST